MKNKNAQIVRFKITNKNSKGIIMKNQIKLSGIDIFGKEHYLKFVSHDFASDLIHLAQPDELEVDIALSSKINPWINYQYSGIKAQYKSLEKYRAEEANQAMRDAELEANNPGNVGEYD